MKRSWDRDGSSPGDAHRASGEDLPSPKLPDALWAVPLGFVVLIPGLVWQRFREIHAVSPRLFAATTLIVLVASAITAAFLYYVVLNRKPRKSLAVTTVLILVVFTWPYWSGLGGIVGAVTGLAGLAEIVTILAATVLIWLTLRYAEHDPWLVAATGVSIGIVVLLVATLVPHLVRAPGHSGTAAATPPPPDTLLLVLDGYAREDVLQADYDFTGRSLSTELRSRGFQVRDDAFSNYSMTHGSLASMMAMDYTFDEGLRDESELESMRNLLSGVSPFIRAYQDAGYVATMFENEWVGSYCSPQLDICVRDGLVRRAVWALGQLSPLSSVQRSMSPHPFTIIGLQHIRALPTAFADDAASPQLVVAHVTVPHAPAQLDATCGFNVDGDSSRFYLVGSDATSEEVDTARDRYAEQVRCVDREVLASIDELLDRNSGMAILVISDHGPDSRGQLFSGPDDWTDDAMIERMAVISALRLPGECQRVEPARSTVNTIRQLANCSLGAELETLPERHYWVPFASAHDVPVVEITSRLHSISAQSGR